MGDPPLSSPGDDYYDDDDDDDYDSDYDEYDEHWPTATTTLTR